LLGKDLPRGRVLDLGSGDGLLTGIVAEAAGWTDLIGLDPDPLECRLASRSGLYRALHVASAETIPEEDGSIDVVFSNSVLEHIPNLDRVLREVGRVLRVGGILITTVPGPGFRQALRGPLLPWQSRSKYLNELDARIAHRHYWAPQEWAEHLRSAGMELITADEYLAWGEVRRWETISRLTAGLLYQLRGRRDLPIDIQRSLGLRRGRTLKPWAATMVAAVLELGMDRRDRGPHGGILIHARKLGSDR
jgi:SAM-dependent methyltransferase